MVRATRAPIRLNKNLCEVTAAMLVDQTKEFKQNFCKGHQYYHQLFILFEIQELHEWKRVLLYF